MACEKVHVLPVVLFASLLATIVLTYVVAVCLGHVEPGFPYVSYTGTYSPESCVFGQLLNLCALLSAVVIYVRYRQMKHFYVIDDPKTRKINIAIFVLGILATLGVSVVANFQVTNVPSMHTIGAVMAFGIGLAYAWLDFFLSFRTRQLSKVSRRVCFIRLSLCLVSTTALALMMSTLFVASAKFRASHGDQSRTKWLPSDGGFTEHVISAVAEWLLVIAYSVYFLTFRGEFRRIHLVIHAVVRSTQQDPDIRTGEGQPNLASGT